MPFDHILNDEPTVERRYQTVAIEVRYKGELICKGTATQERVEGIEESK